nr:putative RNA-directed DNA polymerase, eukaryota, reverse transcriptase zinc-binding domain protein [Tanacetum cinerariifolium]
MVFKVDFEKAFDSLRWDYLDLIMSKFGFGSLWCSWILGSLRNARSSIFINGSPTQEFDIQRGLRQGDPLSPFLFILAMEGLHVLSRKAESLGLFKGVSNGYEGMQISHLLFADDVIFLGELSRVSAINLLSMLNCFYLISGLKINVNKCSLLGIGIADIEVSNLANHIGCVAASTPFKYLGVPVGGNMNRGGAEASQIIDLQVLMNGIVLSDSRDSWSWALNVSKGFSVASARNHIDALTLNVSSTVTRWNKAIPIKINVFLWRLSLNKLATRINLDRRDSLQYSNKSKAFSVGASSTLLWCIWKFRNELLFSINSPRKSTLWDSILSLSFCWISSRNPNCKFRWDSWLRDPLNSFISL